MWRCNLEMEMEDVAAEWGQGHGDKWSKLQGISSEMPSYQQCGEAGSRDADRSIRSLRVDANWFDLRHFAFAKTPWQLKCHCKFATAFLCDSFAHPFNDSLSSLMTYSFHNGHPVLSSTASPLLHLPYPVFRAVNTRFNPGDASVNPSFNPPKNCSGVRPGASFTSYRRST